MQFAKNNQALARLALFAVLALCVAGCASVSQWRQARPDAQAAQGLTAAAPGAPAAESSAGTSPAVVADIVVSQATLHKFEDANRALRAGHADEAERAYRSLVQSDPGLAGPHANLGVIYRGANKLAEAVDEFKQAVRLSPHQPVYQNQLGVTYRQLGQFDKARAAYEQAIALDPNYAGAVLNLGILADMYMGDNPRALDLYTRYLALTPAGDPTVSKWITELKNRKSAPAAAGQGDKAKDKT